MSGMEGCQNEVQFARSLTVGEAWNALQPCYRRFFGDEMTRIADKPVPVDRIPDWLAMKGVTDVRVESYAGRPVADSILDLDRDDKRKVLRLLHHEKRPRDFAWWDEWMQAVPSKYILYGACCHSDFLMSQINWDIEQAIYWGVDPKRRKRVMDKDLGVPILDVSQNAGLRIRRRSHIEQVGALMWIGPLFEKRTGGSWEPLRQYDWCRITKMNGLVRIQSFDRCFDSGVGEQGTRQQILRKALFPNGRPVNARGEEPGVLW